MKGLIIKDFKSILNQSKISMVIIAIWIIVSLVGGASASFGTAIISVFAMALPISSYTFDQNSGFNKFAVCMPISRTKIVISKYVFALILQAIAFVICSASVLIAGFSFSELAIELSALFSVMLLYFAVSMPFLYKFGPEKGRITMTAFFILFFGFFVITDDDVVKALEFILPYLPLISIAGFAASAAISCRIYN